LGDVEVDTIGGFKEGGDSYDNGLGPSQSIIQQEVGA
jgi:hypothetical protein